MVHFFVTSLSLIELIINFRIRLVNRSLKHESHIHPLFIINRTDRFNIQLFNCILRHDIYPRPFFVIDRWNHLRICLFNGSLKHESYLRLLTISNCRESSFSIDEFFLSMEVRCCVSTLLTLSVIDPTVIIDIHSANGSWRHRSFLCAIN